MWMDKMVTEIVFLKYTGIGGILYCTNAHKKHIVCTFSIDFMMMLHIIKAKEMIVMRNVNVTFRVDDELKKQADALFSELGMSLATAFNVFLRQAVREQQIPFSISKNVPNAVTLSAMDAAEKDEGMQGPFDNIEDLMEALNA